MLFIGVALIAAAVTGEIVLNVQGPASNAARLATVTATAAATATAGPATATITATVPAVSPTPTGLATSEVAVIVARVAITQGTLPRPQTVGQLFERAIMAAPAPAGSIASLADLRTLVSPTGRLLETTLLSGAPLLLPHIGYDGGRTASLAGGTTAGDMAVAIQVAGVAGMTGVLKPGDVVDVLSAGPAPGRSTAAAADPLAGVRVRRLATARVLALGPPEGQVTIAVEPEDVANLVAASELQAHLHLALHATLPEPPPARAAGRHA